MLILQTPKFRLSCLAAALLSLSEQSNAQLGENAYKLIVPLSGDICNKKDWTSGTDFPNSYLALGCSRGNINQYYENSRVRYGSLPSQAQLESAEGSWFNYLYSNIPGLSRFIGGIDKNNNPPHHSGGWTIATPQIPLANRIVTPINKVEGLRKPLLPPMRLSRDGRLGVVPGSGGVDGHPQPLRIHLNSPEKLNKHFLESSAGLPTIPETIEVDHSNWGLPGSKTTHFASICEGGKQNPYACGVGGKDDCYDLTLVGSAVKESFSTSAIYEKDGGYRTLYMPQLESGDRLYSRGMKIRIANPKTTRAEIKEVTFGSDIKQSPIQQGVLYEINTPADGRVMVTRRQGLPLVWRHSANGQMRVGSYETVYAVAPDNATPCDASQWGDLRPISHAPFDPTMNKRYGFAKYPFRDPMGNLIPDGEDIKATYPWLDMDAKNISLMISDANLYVSGLDAKPTDKSRFPRTCVHKDDPNNPKDNCVPSDSRDKSNVSQFTLMGAWTKGKMALIDNNLNYADFRINLRDAVRLDLYQPNSALASTTNKSASVEVGGYRVVSGGDRADSVSVDTHIQLQPPAGSSNYLVKDDSFTIISTNKYLVKNSSLFDSIEHRMNYNPHMKPAKPNDVVWLLSSGATSDEFSFDDLLNNNAFIVSDMVAAYTWKNESQFRMTGYDGWNELLGSWSGQVKVQNAATTLPKDWIVPDSGDVVHGRIEPVANGGVKGKGLYFNGNNTRILYNISSNQPQDMSKSTWFHSLFIDARDLSTTVERVLIDFPDKSRLTMLDAGININLKAYNKHGELQKTIAVPSYLVKAKWFNFGVQRTPAGVITFFVNGYPYSEFTAASMFQMTGGDLVLGRAHNTYDYKYELVRNGILDWEYKKTATPATYGTFKGWMDDYKVFAYQPDLETVCNLAHGTLVAPNTNTTMQNLAKLYPQAMHNKISHALQMRGQWSTTQYACYTGDPSQDKTAVLHRLPSGSIPIRTTMHFPEGPLYHDAPRPDSTTNEFCLACHTDSDKTIAGLSKTAALSYKSGLMAKADPRRQPTQPLPFVTGNMPVDFLKSIRPNNLSTSNYIDEHMMPSSAGVVSGVWNLTWLKDGVPAGVMSSGFLFPQGSFSGLRVNTSGLTNRVKFEISNTYLKIVRESNDFSPPFEIAASALTGGTSLKVTAYGSNGQISQKSYTYSVK